MFIKKLVYSNKFFIFYEFFIISLFFVKSIVIDPIGAQIIIERITTIKITLAAYESKPIVAKGIVTK
ncbi:hypothetical protein ESOMN_v1c04650 [Williamsoniiplasma somnilux]|uniref:Uncharacterized protein n=1 Tax=Williamsoniiplasma somnilux TaxID=215578 RepID=A0A2K8NYI1_9MOLU|nr:hypothetical protein [Williamsoniiplasma somnilux]ATZ18847.1 hypothetical protein ESOMN_v1c04650 [Williamsoniiplasma somnilux]